MWYKVPKRFLLILLLLISSYQAQASPRFLEVSNGELKCFADNLYHEARGESLRGIVLVGEVVINRMADRRWPNTVCGVIYQKYQFSWTANRVHHIKDVRTYKLLYDLSFIMLSQRNLDSPHPVNHYLRCDILYRVKWWKHMEFLGAVGHHCFYNG